MQRGVRNAPATPEGLLAKIKVVFVSHTCWIAMILKLTSPPVNPGNNWSRSHFLKQTENTS